MESKDFDSYSERKAFDETKAGVKGLVDAHITEVPRIFRLPQGTLSDKKPSLSSSDLAIPIIDFADVHVSRPRVVEKIKDAAEKWGFFQVVNHGVPLSVLEEMRDGVRRFLSKISRLRSLTYRVTLPRNLSTIVTLTCIVLLHALTGETVSPVTCLLIPQPLKSSQ